MALNNPLNKNVAIKMSPLQLFGSVPNCPSGQKVQQLLPENPNSQRQDPVSSIAAVPLGLHNGSSPIKTEIHNQHY